MMKPFTKDLILLKDWENDILVNKPCQKKLQNIKDRVWIIHIPINYIDSKYEIFLWAKDE